MFGFPCKNRFENTSSVTHRITCPKIVYVVFVRFVICISEFVKTLVIHIDCLSQFPNDPYWGEKNTNQANLRRLGYTPLTPFEVHGYPMRVPL